MATFSILNGKVIRDNTGASTFLRILISDYGASRPLIEYCLAKRRSRSWQEKLLRAVKLFLEYGEVNALHNRYETYFFNNFYIALTQGTINLETRQDPSGLYWHPIKIGQANYMIRQLTDFFDWLGPQISQSSSKSFLSVEKFNPRYTGNKYDERIDKQAYFFRRAKAFLGNTWHIKNQDMPGRRIRGERQPKIFASRPPMFPEERFEELLFKGFKVAGRYDYRSMLITLMLFGGGLRGCEACHLYVADVHPHWDNPTNAFVAIHHPSMGNAPNQWRNAKGQHGSRREYLAAEFGLPPRNESTEAYAGWKHPMLDAEWYMQVHWLPEIYGEWFMQIWRKYMEQIALIRRNHPYAWVNINSEPLGAIYQLQKYGEALKAAVERIDLIFSKSMGTTPHGLRHAYAQRARKNGIEPLILQRLMHHASIESQSVYTQPEVKDVTLAVRKATERLRENNENYRNNNLIFTYLGGERS